jgi:hypothetical protein
MSTEEPETPDTVETANDEATDTGQSLVSTLNRYLDRLESLEDCERLLIPAIGKFENARATAVLDRIGWTTDDLKKGLGRVR